MRISKKNMEKTRDWPTW